MSEIIFLKLGGSLITDKSTPSTARPDVIVRLAGEIAAARQFNPDLKIILGHGSGSFGHVAAKKYGTRQGVNTAEQWLGFAEVWLQASALNRIVIEALHMAGLPAINFPASAAAIAEKGRPISWDVTPIEHALNHNLLPIVHGDVVFDTGIGGTIFSTEDIFSYLTPTFKPVRILLAGIEKGVWADFPACTQIIETITPQSLAKIETLLSGSAATDVTGGMAAKVKETLILTQTTPGLEALIFSGEEPGNVQRALLGDNPGTRLTTPN